MQPKNGNKNQKVYPSKYKMTWAEKLTAPIRDPLADGPPTGLWPFIFYFAKQTKLLIPGIVLLTALEAAIDLMLPLTFGWLIDQLITGEDGKATLQVGAMLLVGFALLFTVVRPLVLAAKGALVELAMMTGFANLVRWQSHSHVLNHDMTYFSDEFAGRIASRVIETGRSVRSVILKSILIVLYLFLYVAGALTVLSQTSPVLMIPLIIWAIINACFLIYVTPKMRVRSREHSRMSAKVTGRVVDSYSNIATVKPQVGSHHIVDD